jgi:transposase
LEFDQGRSALEIALLLGVTRQSVYNWVEDYLRDRDPAALRDEEGRGRPRSLDEDEERLLEALLAGSPQAVGYPQVNWTVPLLQEVLEISTGQRRSDDTLRRALRRLGYVWKRPRYDLEPDPEQEKKTPDSPANPGFAAAERCVGPRRDRPAALSAAARRLVEAGRSRPGLVERPQRPACDLRSLEPANRNPVVCAAGEGTKR